MPDEILWLTVICVFIPVAGYSYYFAKALIEWRREIKEKEAEKHARKREELVSKMRTDIKRTKS